MRCRHRLVVRFPAGAAVGDRRGQSHAGLGRSRRRLDGATHASHGAGPAGRRTWRGVVGDDVASGRGGTEQRRPSADPTGPSRVSAGTARQGARQQRSPSSGLGSGPRWHLRTDAQRHEVSRGGDGDGRGARPPRSAFGNGLFGSHARSGTSKLVAATDRSAARCLERLARAAAAFAIHHRRRSSPNRVLRQRAGVDAASAHGREAGLGMGARLLPCLSVPHQDGRSPVWHRHPGGGRVGGEDAALAARQTARGVSGVALGGGALLPLGVVRVAPSARARFCRWELTAAEQQAYEQAYQYLRTRMALMDYCDYRRRGLAIGSGITEAACKTLFTQRFKQSGMKWSLDGGQVVVDLRVVWLSGLWRQVYATYLAHLPQAKSRTKHAIDANCHEFAA